jgi:hypothetical protein
MVWLAWRQHRLESAVAAGLISLLAVLFVLSGLQAAHAYDALGIGHCLGARPRACALALDEYDRRFAWMGTLRPWLNFVPAIVGVLLAAPLVLELEQGTYRLAWTQGVGRGRWLSARFGYVLLAAVVAGTVTSLLFTWWRRPFDPVSGRLEPSVFDLEGVVPVAYVLFAVALVVAIGALTRRTALAVAGGFVAFLAIRLAVMIWLRPHYLAPLRATFAVKAREPSSGRDWMLGAAIVDRAGHPFDPGALFGLCPPGSGGGDPAACFRRHGVLNQIVYHPAGRFWLFQAIEFALFAGASVALVAVAVWAIRRRVA